MKKTLTETRVGETLVRYRIRLQDDPSSPSSWEARNRLFQLLETVCASRDLLNCGPSAPQKMTISHNGESWVLEAEATIETEV